MQTPTVKEKRFVDIDQWLVLEHLIRKYEVIDGLKSLHELDIPCMGACSQQFLEHENMPRT